VKRFALISIEISGIRHTRAIIARILIVIGSSLVCTIGTNIFKPEILISDAIIRINVKKVVIIAISRRRTYTNWTVDSVHSGATGVVRIILRTIIIRIIVRIKV